MAAVVSEPGVGCWSGLLLRNKEQRLWAAAVQEQRLWAAAVSVQPSSWDGLSGRSQCLLRVSLFPLPFVLQLAVTIGILRAQLINLGTQHIKPWGWRLRCVGSGGGWRLPVQYRCLDAAGWCWWLS